MAGRLKTVCGLDIRKDSICMATFSPEARAVTGVGVQPFDDSSVDWWKRLGASLKKLIASESSLVGQDVVCSMPAEWATIKDIPVDRDELHVDGVIQWEMGQQVLGNIDDFALDYQKIINHGDTEFDHYLVVAFRRDSVKRLADIVKANKFNPIVVDLDVFGLINLLEANYADSIGTPSVLIHGDNDQVTLVLTQSAEFIDIEVVHFSFDPGDLAGCLAKVNEGLAGLRTAHPVVFQTVQPAIYLAGTTFSFPEVSEYILANLAGATILYPFNAIAFQGGGIEDEDLRKYAPRLAAAIGLAIRGGAELEE